jgi:hypothetical protein
MTTWKDHEMRWSYVTCSGGVFGKDRTRERVEASSCLLIGIDLDVFIGGRILSNHLDRSIIVLLYCLYFVLWPLRKSTFNVK